MCYDSDARPPQPPGAAGKAYGQRVELTGEDGNRFAAYAARSGEGWTGARVLIYPDVRGLYKFYEELAMRFAEQGIDAIAIDYFGRTAGVGERDDSFEYMPHVEKMEFPSVLSDARAALKCLRGNEGGATFTLGFCMGGSLSLLTGTQDLGLAGVIGFYTGFSRRFTGSEGTALEEAHKIRYPVLGLYGGADQSIPVSAVEQLGRELDRAGVEHELKIYPGATHSFFDRRYTEFAKESADAWERVLGFIKAHSG